MIQIVHGRYTYSFTFIFILIVKSEMSLVNVRVSLLY